MFKYNILYFAINFLMIFYPNFAKDLYSKFHQIDYKMEFQRLELIDYKNSAFNFVEIKTFKYNRSQPVLNATFNSKLNFSTEMELSVQFYKFLSNEYRILPGVNFQINCCKSVDRNLAGVQILRKCGNYTSCKIVQGTTYKVCNFYPDGSRLPPFLPSGEYKFNMDFLLGDDIIATIAAYLSIYRPVPIPK